jgi:hypothetical protein
VSLRALLAAAVLVASVTACTTSSRSDQASSPRLSDRPLRDIGGCIQADEASLELYDDGDVTAAVALIGSGRSGVVVSHEENVSVCNWVRAADALARAGYAVLLYERISGSAGAFVPAMAELMRQRGARRVALLGGAAGGALSISEAAFMEPPPSAVVSLAGADTGTVQAVRELPAPLLQIVSEGDAAFAPALATDAAAGPGRHRLLVLSGNAHASMIFPVHARAMRAVVGFLRRVMPP